MKYNARESAVQFQDVLQGCQHVRKPFRKHTEIHMYQARKLKLAAMNGAG